MTRPKKQNKDNKKATQKTGIQSRSAVLEVDALLGD